MFRPVKVLCFYRAWAKTSKGTLEFKDSVMVHVRHSDDILLVFLREMAYRCSKDYRHSRYRVGPRPTAYELMFYLAENGKTKF